MNRWVLLASCLLAASPALGARPDIGLKYHREGKNLVLDHPKVVKHAHAAKPLTTRPALAVQPKAFLPLMQPGSLDGFEVTAGERLTEQMIPGDFIVRHFSTGTGAFDAVEDDTTPFITDEAWKAIALAPDWIRLEMISNLAQVSPALQDALAGLMTGVEDQLWLDEIAFMIANTAPEDLMHESFRPGYLADQARFLYLADPILDYVSLKEVGEPGNGDYWTTTIYKYTEEGVEKEWELPREYYYWWILHSRLDGEEQIDIDPATGKWAQYPAGVTYKEYYMFDPETVESATKHYIFRTPPPYEKYKGMEVVPYETLNGWKPSSRGWFPQWPEIAPMTLTFDSQGQPTTIEFKVRPKGIVLATTLLVEKAQAEGKSHLLGNMLRYGPGNVVIRDDWKHVVIMERAPFGKEGVIEDILDAWLKPGAYEIVDSTWLAEADLAEVRKIIVPSDQPLAVYQSVADNREKLQTWLAEQWRILEIHAAVSKAEDDWSGLVMPGGFTVEGVADLDDDAVVVEGQPPMMKYLAGTKTIWDLQQHPGMTGDRPCDPDTFALDKIGWWSSQNIFDSAVDFGEKHNWLFSMERSSDSVRVLYNHYGNCGENQDVITSASRSCLVPAANSSNGPEDHVWTEYFFADSWHTYQMGWADAPTDIDTPGISSGKKWGGGKNISFVTSSRGDGALINRTDYYHYTGDIKVNVVDADGNPIKGAWVFIVTETFYKMDGEYPLTFGFWDYTGEDGSVTIQAGANIEEDLAECKNPDVELRCNNYYIKVVTRIGNYPPEEGLVDLIVEDIEAGKGFEKEVNITVNGHPTVRRAGEQPVAFDQGDPGRVLRFSADMLEEMHCGYGLWAGKFCEPGDAVGALDFYVLDQPGFVAFMKGEPFQALAAQEEFGDGYEFTALAPPAGDWYFVVVNNGRFQWEQLLDARLEVLEPGETPPPPEETAPVEELRDQDTVSPAPDVVPGQDTLFPDVTADTGTGKTGSGGDSGCSTTPAGTPAPLFALLLMIAFLGIVRRCRA